MLENQAFGWLRQAIGGGGGDASSSIFGIGGVNGNGGGDPKRRAAIDACSDPAMLLDGAAADFAKATAARRRVRKRREDEGSAAVEGGQGGSYLTPVVAAPAATGIPTPEKVAIANGGKAVGPSDADESATEESLGDLVARLDRLKILLYEERSSDASSSMSALAASTPLNPLADVMGVSVGGAGDPSPTPVASSVLRTFATAHPELFPEWIGDLSSLPFEARKSASAIFNYLLVCGLDGSDAAPYAVVSNAFGAYVLRTADRNMEEGRRGGDGRRAGEGGILGGLVEGHRASGVGGGGDSADTAGGADSSVMIDTGSFSSAASVDERETVETASPTVPVLKAGNGCVDVALLCGSMLRSSLRHPEIYRWILSDGRAERFVYPFLDHFVHDPNFDVSSDALETVRVMLTGDVSGTGGTNDGNDTSTGTEVGGCEHLTSAAIMESIASEFLERKYEEVVNVRINRKCLSSSASYINRRMSLQLLSTVLLTRANYVVMMRYVSSRDNLVTIMLLLRDPSPHITLDAFQVFKIFVANPSKPDDVRRLLYNNKSKLVKYLEGLHKERERGDEQFRDEKALVVSTLEGLEG